MGIQVGDNIYEIVKLRSKHKQASKTKPVLYRINELGCHEVFHTIKIKMYIHAYYVEKMGRNVCTTFIDIYSS